MEKYHGVNNTILYFDQKNADIINNLKMNIKA